MSRANSFPPREPDKVTSLTGFFKNCSIKERDRSTSPMISRLEMIEKLRQENLKNSGEFKPSKLENSYTGYSGNFRSMYAHEYMCKINEDIESELLQERFNAKKFGNEFELPEPNVLLEQQKAVVALNWEESIAERHRQRDSSSRKAVVYFELDARVFDTKAKKFIPIDPTNGGQFEQGTRFKIYTDGDSTGFEVQVDKVERNFLRVKYAIRHRQHKDAKKEIDVEKEIRDKSSFNNQKVTVHIVHNDFQYFYATQGINRMLKETFEYFVRPDKYAKRPLPLTDAETQEFDKLIQAICHYLEVNKMEAQAIYSICASTSKQFPLVIYGPCGSGKTTVVCKAVELLYEINPKFRILICAPTNKHARAIAENFNSRFDKSKLEGKVVYLRASSCSYAGRNPKLDRLCCIDYEIEEFDPSAKHRMEDSRVLICTATSAAHLHRMGVRPGYFSHMFYDETSLMSLSDLFISIGLYATPRTQTILVGDQFQLPPVCKLNLPKKYTEFMSTLRNYLRLGVYNGNPNLSCLLTQSYRISEHLLDLISDVFYESEDLIGVPNKPIQWVNSLFKRDNKLPFAFIDVPNGKEARAMRCYLQSSDSYTNKEEEDSMSDELQIGNSYTNKEETEAICWVINQMVNVEKINPKHIGIVIGYRAHIKDVRLALKDLQRSLNGIITKEQINQIMVNSVETFQGTERKFIIFAATRTNQDNIGFMKQLERIYTAISRARESLFVLGHSNALSSASKTWEQLIGYFKERDVFYEFENGGLVHVNNTK